MAETTGYRTKRDVAVELLREAIVGGELAPGTRLVLEELSQRYSVSMTPIREALSILESEGLIVQHPHRGATVAALDREALARGRRVTVPLIRQVLGQG